MSALKKLLSQTAVYGITNILGRFLNFLLVPLYTSVLIPEAFAVVTVFYALAAFVNVVLSFGMETTYFSFSRTEDKQTIFNQTHTWILILSAVFLLAGLLFPGIITIPLGYPEYPSFARWFVLILAADALSVIPFARLRQENKALRFGLIKLGNIAINIGLNVFFLWFCPKWMAQGHVLNWYQPDFGVGYIFISNLAASLFAFILLLPELRAYRPSWNPVLMRSLLQYATPLVIVGFAGMINEVLDRILLKHLLPAESADFDTGVYGAFYRLSIIISIFIQAFRFAAEPFFFEKSKDQDAKSTYAKVMNYFVAVCAFIFLATMLFLNDLAPLFIRKAAYFEHPWAILVVPVLLLANVFLGIYYNLNIWYKLENKNRIGAVIALTGAALTLILNLMLIPVLGIMGSALTTLVVYFLMVILSYSAGRKHYPVPYQTGRILFYLIAASILYLVQSTLALSYEWADTLSIKLVLLLVFLLLVWVLERPEKKW